MSHVTCYTSAVWCRIKQLLASVRERVLWLLHVMRSEIWLMWQCCAVKAPGDSGRWHYSPLASDDPGVILCSLTSHISHECWLYVVHCSHLVTCHSHSSLSPACLLTQYPGQTALPSLLFSAPAQLSRSPGYLARLWSARLTPGQGETHNETLRPGPGSRKTRRYSLTTWCFVLKLI